MTENRIRELRRRHNMSQEALGTIINTTQQVCGDGTCVFFHLAYQHGKVF